MPRFSLLAVLLCLAGGFAAAQTTPASPSPPAPTLTCRQDAAERSLSGTVLTTFLATCEENAKTKCESAAAERRLAGPARDSYIKTCVTEVVGEPKQ